MFLYSGSSVYLSSVVTLKAKAFKTGYNDSAVASETYTINSAPAVSAGPQQILTGTSTTLQGWVMDDGLTGGGTRFTNWSKVAGPGSVTFGNASQSNSTAMFGADGIYTLKLSASDGQYTNSSEVICCELFSHRKNAQIGVAWFSGFCPRSHRILRPNNRALVVAL